MRSIINRITTTSLVLAATVFLNVRTFSQEIHFKVLKSLTDWQTATEESKMTGKDIFLDIYASWCGPCKMMDANVYTEAGVYEYYNSNFINLKIDGETDFGRQLASQYKLTAYPSMYFINSKEELVHEIIGYREPGALLKSGQDVRTSGKRYMELLAKFKSEVFFSKEQTAELLNLLVTFGDKYYLNLVSKDIIASYTLEDIINPANKAVIIAVASDINASHVKIVMQNADTLKSIWGNEDYFNYLSAVFNESMQYATEQKDSSWLEKLVVEFVPVYMKEDAGRIPEAQLTTRKIYYAQTEDWQKYIQAVEKHYEEFQNGNLRFLYMETYYIIENQIFNPDLLRKSNEWLTKVIADQPGFEPYFLSAIVNTYLEDFTTARKWMSMAEGVAVTEDEKNSLTELKGYLEEL